MVKKTLIEFPCYFPIKIIGDNSSTFLEEIKQTARTHFANLAQDAISYKTSKNSNYLSITVTVLAKDQDTLDAFYQTVTKNPAVKMVL